MTFNDKDKQRKAQHDWYMQHKDLLHEGRAEARKRHKEKLFTIMMETKARGCSLCGYNKCLAAIDFHHVSGVKKFEIGNAVHIGVSVNQLKIEISKCIVVCANCHREIHEELTYGRSSQLAMAAVLKTVEP